MKKITLLGPAVRNDGGYVDAGATLTIGADVEEINAKRAQDLVDGGTAVSETEGKRLDKVSIDVGADVADEQAAK